MANKLQPLLVLDPPEELIFEGPLNRPVCQKLVISNPSKNFRVTFKLKTTSPRLFFVRPNIGILNSQEKITVEIFMQPILERDLKQKRHKFLIQATEVVSDFPDLQQYWKSQKEKAGDIWDTKLRCEIIPIKTDDERQADGGIVSSRNSKNDEGDCDVSDEHIKPMAIFKGEVRALEEESLQVKQEIEIDDVREVASILEMQPQSTKRPKYVYLMACLFTIFAAIMVAYGGKSYL